MTIPPDRFKSFCGRECYRYGNKPRFDVDESLSRELKREFRIDDSDTFRRLLNKDGSLVVIGGDNSGEIVLIICS